MAVAGTVLIAVGFSYPAIGFSNDYSGPFALAILVIWLYAAYWAFDIRKALSAPLFRNQALGMGLLALGWLAFNAVFSIPVAGAEAIEQSEVAIPVLIVAILLTFYWIDASILAAQRTDPLRRDTLHWSVVRKFVWTIFVGFIATDLAAIGIPALVSVVDNAVYVEVVLIPLAAVTGVTFAVSVSRSRDRTIRRHLRWFGLSLLGFFGVVLLVPAVGTALGLNANDIGTAAQGVGFTLFSYFVYRSAKSLAPLEHLGSTTRGTEPRQVSSETS